MPHITRRLALTALLFTPLLTACGNGSKIDPWENTNRFFYTFDDNFDKYFLKPLADAYVKVIPKEVRHSINNGFDNLGYFNVILNDLLQAKWQQGGSDTMRMALNSTIGLAGVFDVATPSGFPRHENDFGITLGKWGYDAGPYLVLPIFGPSSIRDVFSYPVEIATNPLTYVDTPTWVGITLGVTQAVDERSQYESLVKFRNAAALDPYIFTRDAYLAYRLNQINEGHPTTKPKGEDIFNEPDEDTTQPATQPAITQPARNPNAP